MHIDQLKAFEYMVFTGADTTSKELHYRNNYLYDL